jgi:transcription initiation factor TFIIIB Brf1 subunit/transcription initiation factor TFIIB
MKTQQVQPTRDSSCPKCKSENIEFDEAFGSYQCNDCGEIWAYPEDDPDYDELDDEDLN